MITTQQIKEQVEEFVKEIEKFNNGNSAAGTRARKALGEIAKLCKQRRGEIMEEKAKRKLEKSQGE